MKIHRAEVIGTFTTITGSTINATGSFRGSFEGDSKLATTGSNTFNGNQTVNGDMTVTGRIVAEEFHTELISSSIIYKSGSTKFGDSLDDNHGFTGSLSISGSLNINGTSYSAATSGTSGVNGSSGDTGSSGSAGTSGVDGTSGTSGADGSSGATGSSGSAGTSGSSGLSVGNAYLHTQSSSSSTWTITHNLNYKYLSVTVYDSSDNVMLPESIIADSVNQLTISFGVSESGYAMLSYGASSSGTSGASGNSGTSGSSGSSGTSAGSASRNVTTFIATSGQTTFTISGGYTVGLVDVFVNGVRYSPTDFTATNGTTVVLGVGVDVDDVVDIIDYVSSMTAIAGEGTTGTIPKYTASGTIGNSIITDNGTNATVNGSLTVTGNLTAQQFIISSSVTHLTESFASGSHKFGDSSDDNHNFTGSLIVSGSANPLNVGSNLLFVSSSGNVAINGTPTSFSNNIYFDIIGNTTTQGGILQSRNSDNSIIGSFFTNTNGLNIRTETNNAILLSTAGTERMRIEDAGSTVFSHNVFVRANDRGYSVQHSDGTYNAGLGNLNGSNLKTGYLYLNQNGGTTIQLHANGTTYFNGGNVGIGTSSPFSNLHVRGSNTNEGAIAIGNEGYPCVLFSSAATGEFRIDNRASSSGGYISFYPNGQQNSVGNERMRITPSGPVLIGTTTAFSAGLLCLQGSSAVYNILSIKDTYAGPFNDVWYLFLSNDSGARAGGIQHTASTTVSFVTSSDYRLKEDFKQVKGLETLLKIKTYDFKFKDEDFRMDGVIAHELAEVLPYAVSGVKDGEKMQGVDYSKLVPVLIKSVQELSAELTSAKQEIELLKLK